MKKKEILKCSFCSKTQSQVEKLVKGENHNYICNECITICSEGLKSLMLSSQGIIFDHNYKPKQIKGFLDDYIIGQEHAKKVISVAVSNHYKRINYQKNITPSSSDEKIEIEKSNVLLIGPTGSGKTALIKKVSQIFNVPFAHVDANSLTETGYVGEDVTAALYKLLQSAEYDIKKAECGIVYIDEIDKIARKSQNSSLTPDISREGVQQALLKMIEGDEVSIQLPNKHKSHNSDSIILNTQNILFICSGAYEGLDKIIKDREQGYNVGFGAEILAKDEKKIGDILAKVQADDLVKYGMIPELIGRLPIIITLDELNEDNLISILTKPKNAILKQYSALLNFDSVELEVTDTALKGIAQKALAKKNGARGLRSIIEELLLDCMYDLSDYNSAKKVIIDEECVAKNGKAKILELVSLKDQDNSQQDASSDTTALPNKTAQKRKRKSPKLSA